MNSSNSSQSKKKKYPFRVTLAADAVTQTRGGGVCWRTVKKKYQYITEYEKCESYFRLYGKQRNYSNSKLFLPFTLQNAEEVLLTFEQDLYQAHVEFIMDKAVVSLPDLVKHLINLVVTIESRQNCRIDLKLVSKNSLCHNQALLAASLMSTDQEINAESFMMALSNNLKRQY